MIQAIPAAGLSGNRHRGLFLFSLILQHERDFHEPPYHDGRSFAMGQGRRRALKAPFASSLGALLCLAVILIV